jgi:transposase
VENPHWYRDEQRKLRVVQRRVSRRSLDAGWGYLKQRLIDKAEEAGRMDRDGNVAINILQRAGHARWDESTTDGLRLLQEAPPL